MRQPASENSRSQDISRATAAALNCCEACDSGVSSVMPCWAALNSDSACLTRLTVAAGASGFGLLVPAGVLGAADPGLFAAASAALASASSCFASTTACCASTAASAPAMASSRGRSRSVPASLTSPTVGAVWLSTSPYRSSAVM